VAQKLRKVLKRNSENRRNRDIVKNTFREDWVVFKFVEVIARLRAKETSSRVVGFAVTFLATMDHPCNKTPRGWPGVNGWPRIAQDQEGDSGSPKKTTCGGLTNLKDVGGPGGDRLPKVHQKAKKSQRGPVRVRKMLGVAEEKPGRFVRGETNQVKTTKESWGAPISSITNRKN